jgi:glycosyltransferase 2 family protein
MRKRLFSIFKYLIFLCGGAALVWWQLSDMTPTEKSEFADALNHANYWLVIPVVIMSILSHVSRSMRWKLLMEPLGYKPALRNVFGVTMVGYLANTFIPRLGEILKCTMLAKREHLKTDKLVGTILVERTFDFICYLIFIAITILIQIKVVGNYAKNEMAILSTGSKFPVWAKLVIFVTGIVAIIYYVKYLLKKHPHNKIIIAINNFFRGMGDGFKTIRNLKHRRLFLVHTIFIWSMYLLQIYVGFSAIEGTVHLGLKAACSVLALATLAMIATPGGLGSFPFFVMETLALYHISQPMGKAFGWLIWGVSTGIILIVGLSALIILLLSKIKNTHETDESDPGKNIHDGAAPDGT